MARKILLVHGGKSFLPEVEAYKKFLQSFDVDVSVGSELCMSNEFDGCIRFPGLLRRQISSSSQFEIHDFNSCSTGSWARAKDLAKVMLNVEPSIRLFQSPAVEAQYTRFNRHMHSGLYRRMGVDRDFSNRGGIADKKEFDACYVGSLDGRPGLVEFILKFASTLSFKIAVAGPCSRETYTKFTSDKRVTYFGVISREEVIRLTSRSRSGLNYVPVIYPFYFQESTKLLEYFVSGLPIISNRYLWAEEFARKHPGSVIFLDQIEDRKNLLEFVDEFVPASEEQRSRYFWNTIFEEARIVDLIS